jgi:predicted DNA-binding transcriptional regulator YafY
MHWHVHAYCEKNADYRDFVLIRFRGLPKLMDDLPDNTR